MRNKTSGKSKFGKPECGLAELGMNDVKTVQQVRGTECGDVQDQKCLVCGANLSRTAEWLNICESLIEEYYPDWYKDRTECGPAEHNNKVPECGIKNGEAKRKRKRSVGGKEKKESKGKEKEKEVEFKEESTGIGMIQPPGPTKSWLTLDKTGGNERISGRQSTKLIVRNKTKSKNLKQGGKCRKLGQKVQKITNFFEKLQKQSSGVKWVEKTKVNSKLYKQANDRGGLVASGLKQEVGELTEWGGEGDTRPGKRGGGVD